MTEYRISYISAFKDLTGRVSIADVSSKSKISHDFLENIVAAAQAKLKTLDDNSGASFNFTLAIAVFERKIVKILGLIPIVAKEQLVWRESKTSKGTLPIRMVA